MAVNLASAVYSFGLYPSLSRAGSASFISMVTVALAGAISIVALVQLVILYFLPSQKGLNKYGPNLLNPTGEAEVFS